MSTVSSVSTSSSASYATELAKTLSIKRTLYNLGQAVQKGDLTSANSILTDFIKAHPEYSTSSSSDSSSSSTSGINQDFQTLQDALTSNDTDAAKSAWAQIKTDLTESGVTLSNGSDETAQLLAKNKASTEQQLISALFDTSSSSDSSSVLSLLSGSSSSSSDDTTLSSSLLSNWVTYKENGTTSSSSTSSTSSTLDTSA